MSAEYQPNLSSVSQIPAEFLKLREYSANPDISWIFYQPAKIKKKIRLRGLTNIIRMPVSPKWKNLKWEVSLENWQTPSENMDNSLVSAFMSQGVARCFFFWARNQKWSPHTHLYTDVRKKTIME